MNNNIFVVRKTWKIYISMSKYNEAITYIWNNFNFQVHDEFVSFPFLCVETHHVYCGQKMWDEGNKQKCSC